MPCHHELQRDEKGEREQALGECDIGAVTING
jgi:hypothetical protein